MKRFGKNSFAMLLAFVMLVSLLPGTAFAADTVSSGTCGDGLTWTLDDQGVLTISGTGDMDNFDGNFNPPPWTAYSRDITEVVIGDHVTSIGDWAFHYYINIKSVTIADSVIRIGDGAFMNCSGLTGVVIPDSVLYICDRAFGSCSSLSDVAISNRVVSIGPGAFSYCSSLTCLEIPDSVITIGSGAFGGCSGLTQLTIPASVTSIGSSAFIDCSGLTGLTIPEGLTDIGSRAFSGCKGLAEKEGFVLVNTILFDYYGTESEIVIPAGTTRIDDYAFYANKSLTGVTIPASVTYIGLDAFANCRNLKSARFECSYNYNLSDEMFAGLYEGYRYELKIYYPAADASWTEEAKARFFSELHSFTWIPYGEEPPAPTVGFTDVPANAYYAEAVAWAVEKGITGGTTATTFSPNNACTRGQIVQFLWNAAGRPEPTSTDNPFTDVKSTAYYYKAVLWAVEEGITGGTSPTEFSPTATCTRAQVVKFLHNRAEQPAPESTTNKFTDVSSTAYYYKAVLWAVEQGITGGTSPTAFSPSDTCTRAQIVKFLYNAMAD